MSAVTIRKKRPGLADKPPGVTYRVTVSMLSKKGVESTPCCFADSPEGLQSMAAKLVQTESHQRWLRKHYVLDRTGRPVYQYRKSVSGHIPGVVLSGWVDDCDYRFAVRAWLSKSSLRPHLSRSFSVNKYGLEEAIRKSHAFVCKALNADIPLDIEQSLKYYEKELHALKRRLKKKSQ